MPWARQPPFQEAGCIAIAIVVPKLNKSIGFKGEVLDFNRKYIQKSSTYATMAMFDQNTCLIGPSTLLNTFYCLFALCRFH